MIFVEIWRFHNFQSAIVNFRDPNNGFFEIAFSVRILATDRQTNERTDGENQRVKPLPRFSEIGSLLFSEMLDSENDRNCTHHNNLLSGGNSSSFIDNGTTRLKI